MELIELMTAGAETFCILVLLHSFFPSKRLPLFSAALAAVFFLLYLWLPLHTVLAQSLVTKLLVSILLWLIFAQLVHTGSWFSHLFLLCSLFLAVSGLDFFTLLGLSFFFSCPLSQVVIHPALYILGAFCSRSLSVLLAILFCRLPKSRRSAPLAPGSWIALLLLSLFSILLFGILLETAMAQTSVRWPFVLAGMGLLVFQVCLSFLLSKLEQDAQLRQTNQALQREMEQNLRAAQAMQAVFEAQRAQSHDFHNHMAALRALLQQAQYQKATEYVQALCRDLPADSGVIRTNNPIVDTVLNEKYAQARLQNTSMRFTIQDLSAFPMEDKDLVTLLGNLLDNALEACRKCSGPSYISLKILPKKDGFLLSAENTSPPVKILEGSQVQTDKTDPLLHGFGLANIRRILEKYGWEYTLFYEDGRFHFVSFLG